MDFGKAFSYQFDTEDWWKSLLFTGLISLIPIVGVIYALGWMMEIAGRFAQASDTETVELPGVDFGSYLRKGFLGLVAGFVYSLPSMLVALPIIIVGAVASSQSGDTASIVASIVGICCGGLSILLAIAGGLLAYPAIVEIQLTDSLKAAFNFQRIFAIFKNAIVPYLLSILVTVIVSPILSSIGAVLCGLGALFTMPYSFSLMGYFFGSAYKEGVASLESSEVVEI